MSEYVGLGSLAGIPQVLGVLSLLTAAYIICTCIYNLYFHPLAHIPGPFWARATPIPYILLIRNGGMVPWIHKMHQTYGEAVRVSPTEVSFISGETAWQDIYGFRSSKTKSASYQKSLNWYPPTVTGSPSMLSANDADHARMRKNFTHAFSERALRDQEVLVQSLVDLLIQRLHEEAEAGRAVDMVAWFNYTTFDIITDLTFGEPLGNLRDRSLHNVIKLVFANLKASGIVAMRRRYAFVRYFDKICSLTTNTPDAAEKRAEFGRFTTAKVNQRVENGATRPDFFQPVLRNLESGDKGLSRAEMISNSITLMTAGSETTATLLSGLTYLVLQHPDIYTRLVTEIRERFDSPEAITFDAITKLEYTIAVINEALRFYPPVPTGFPREAPKGGDTVSGYYIPGGTTVYVSQHASNHSTRNWTDPDVFAPERWFGAKAPSKYKDDNHASMNAFSFGPRNCLGKNLAYAELRLITAKLLWHFDLELLPSSADWIERNKLFMLLDKPPLMVQLKAASR